MLYLLLACATHVAYQGRLIDSKGTPVPNAKITFQEEGLSCQSDIKGYCTTDKKLQPNLEYTYTISSLGYQSLTKTIRLQKKQNRIIEIVLYNKEIYLPYRKRNLDQDRK